MSDTPDEELGPIDYLVVEFPEGTKNFTGAMARELASLAEAELIRVFDLLILEKANDGTIDALEIEDIGDLGVLGTLEAGLAEILALG